MKKRVLVVDDDQAVRDSLQKVLREAGYEVTVSPSGREALGEADLETLDLVLLDLSMPQENGWDVFEPLTRRHPLVPIIIITGLPNQYPTALAAGAGALMEKPIEVPALLKTMDELLAEPKADRLRRLCGQLDDTRFVPPACKLFLDRV